MDQIKGNVISAMENYTKALELSENIPALDLNRSVCYINIGEIHRVLKDYDGAYLNYKKSLRIRQRINNKDGVAACYLRLGQIKVYREDFDSAAFYFRKSVDIYSNTKNSDGLAISKRNLGALYIEHGSLDSAVIYLKESADILKSRSDEKGTTESELYMAIALEKKGQVNEAVDKLRSVFKWSADNDISDLAREAAGSLAPMLAELGKFEEAYFYRTAHKEYNDKLLSEKNIAQVALKEYKLKSQKEAQEERIQQLKVESELRDRFLSARNIRNTFILVAVLLLVVSAFIFRTAVLRRKRNERLSEQKQRLNEQNKALQELSEELQSTLEDKDTLMKEVHHRVKNNLQVILSLLNAQMQNLSDDLAINAIQDSQNRIKAMVLIHQNIYQSNEVSVVKSSKYVQDMVDSIHGSDPRYD
ncbi:MAG: histidine kinase dimerization/phosphoacceptor domain -containing protein, partial [Bacteroidota bacterium]